MAAPSSQPAAGGADTLGYLCDIIRRAEASGRPVGSAHPVGHPRRGPDRSAHPERRHAALRRSGVRPGASETRPPPCRSMRPASASSIRAICTLRMLRPVPRTRLSMSTGAGPSAATMRSRSLCGQRRRQLRPAAPAPRATAAAGARVSGVSADSTSSGSVTSVAPDFSSLLVPSARGSSGWPGMANTSRPCSAASRAVTRLPERRAASTMSDAQRQARDDAVAARKVLAARGKAERHLADEAAALADLALQLVVLGRIDIVEAAGEHRDGAGVDRRLMRHAVDAARQARGDDEAGAADLVRELACQLGAGRRALPRADDGDGRAAAAGRCRPWRRAAAAALRARPAAPDTAASPTNSELGAVALRALELGLRFIARANADAAPVAAALRQLRECGERCRGAAVVLQQLAKGDGTDVLGADRAAAPRCARRRSSSAAAGVCDHALAPILGSSPAARRRMLARCL